MHCHIRDHVIPAPERDAESRGHDLHDVTRHPLEAMAGLVMGITVSDDGPPEADGAPVDHLRLIARQAPAAGGVAFVRGFSLNRGAAAVADLTVPGPPIVLRRGATTRITVENEMDEPTSVHWHGLELQSVYDGVAGWSRSGDRVAPLVGPGDAFDVYLAPPRAGTFMYHSHMDETTQLTSGMYGPIIVLDPGETLDPETDRIFVIGHAYDGDYWGVTINGRKEPPALRLRAGARYRFRFINISEGDTVNVSLEREGQPLTWLPHAKDGADLPAPLQAEAIARVRTGAGETFDFFHAPAEAMQATLTFDWVFPTFVGNQVLKQSIIVE
jgi:FtsP/CotA-like multicopper oxidase with cupredoxin domain